MPDNIVRKRVTLHPLNEDGTIDLNTNLYPKTFLDGIVDREGNPVDVQKKLTAGENITIDENNVISSHGGVTEEELQETVAEAVADLITEEDAKALVADKITEEQLDKALDTTNRLTELDITDMISSSDANKLSKFVDGNVPSDLPVSFPFNEEFDLKELKGYQTLKIDSIVDVDKQYRIIESEPDLDEVPPENIYWDWTNEVEGFPTAGINTFTYDKTEIPSPTSVPDSYSWGYVVRPYPSRWYDDVEIEYDTDSSVWLLVTCSSYSGAKDYARELEDAGWQITLSSENTILGQSAENCFEARKSNLVLLCGNNYQGNGTFVLAIKDESPDAIYELMQDFYYEELNFPSTRVNNYLAQDDIPLPPHKDLPAVDNYYWSSDFYLTKAKEHIQPQPMSEEVGLTNFPLDELMNNFLFNSNNVWLPIPTAHNVKDWKTDWKWNYQILVRESPELPDEDNDNYEEKPYTYFYTYHQFSNRGTIDVNEYVDSLREAGWTVEEMPVWVSAGENQNGYHATYNKYGHNITINFALSADADEELAEDAEDPSYYFDMVFIDRSPSIPEDFIDLSLYYELQDNQQNLELFLQYIETLRNDGWELEQTSYTEDVSQAYTATKDNVSLFISIDYAEFGFGIRDKRPRVYQENLTLYFKNKKETEDGNPVYEFSTISNDNKLITMVLTPVGLVGNVIGGSGGDTPTVDKVKVLELEKYVDRENVRDQYYNQWKLDGGYTTENTNLWDQYYGDYGGSLYGFRGNITDYIIDALGTPKVEYIVNEEWDAQHQTYYNNTTYKEDDPKNLNLILVMLKDGIHIGRLGRRSLADGDFEGNSQDGYVQNNEDTQPYGPDNPEKWYIYLTEDASDIEDNEWEPINTIKLEAFYHSSYNPTTGDWETTNEIEYWMVNNNYHSLKNDIQTLRNSIRNTNDNVAQLTNKVANGIAREWVSNTYYSIGDLVYYSNFLYRSLRDSNRRNYPTGYASSNTYWEYVTLKSLLSSVSGAVNDVQINGTSILNNKVANIQTNSAYNASTNKIATMTEINNVTSIVNNLVNNFAPVWSSASVHYIVGDVVIYNNLLYECILEHTSSSGSAYKPDTGTTYWKRTTIVASTIGILTEAM